MQRKTVVAVIFVSIAAFAAIYGVTHTGSGADGEDVSSSSSFVYEFIDSGSDDNSVAYSIPLTTKGSLEDVDSGKEEYLPSPTPVIDPNTLTAQSDKWKDQETVDENSFDLEAESGTTAVIHAILPIDEYIDTRNTLVTKTESDDIGTLTLTYCPMEMKFTPDMFDNSSNEETRGPQNTEKINGIYGGKQVYGIRQVSSFWTDNHGTARFQTFDLYSRVAVQMDDDTVLVLDISQEQVDKNELAGDSLLEEALSHVEISNVSQK